MNLIGWGLRFLIPFVVLFTIGYYVPGFSALTIPWLMLLSGLIAIGDWWVNRIIGGKTTRWGRGLITLLLGTAVIYFVTFAIEGGHVPLGGSSLAALFIAVFSNLINFEQFRESAHQGR